MAQIAEGCPPPELVALIARNNEASLHMIAAAHLVATVPANQGALLDAGLLDALIPLIASEAPLPPQRPALIHPLSGRALALLLELLGGPDAAETAAGIVAACGVKALVALLPVEGVVGGGAAKCLLFVTKFALHLAVEIADGALPALMEAVQDGGGKGTDAARTLLHLTTTQVAVEAEVIAAGLDVAALRGLAGLPFDPLARAA